MQENPLRFEHRGKGSFDRPPTDRLIETLDGLKKGNNSNKNTEKGNDSSKNAEKP